MKPLGKRGLFPVIVISLTMILILIGQSIGAEKEPYKIGAIYGITGVASFLGDPQKKTALMLQEEINATGGINGHPLEIIIEDTKSEEAQAVLLAKKLIVKDKVVAIVGPSTSGESMAVVPITEKENIPHIAVAAAITIVTPEDEIKRMMESPKKAFETPTKQRRWIFKTTHTDTQVVEKIYDYMKAKNISKVAIITVSAGFGDSGRSELLRLAPRFGITVVADERYGPKDTDMTAQLTKIKRTDAQAVINWSVGPPQIIVMKNWKDLGMKIPLYQSHGFGSKRNIELAGGAAEGVFAPLQKIVIASKVPENDIQKRALMEYKTKYESKYKTEVSVFGGNGIDALNIVIAALKAVGPDRVKIRDYIENLKKFVGISGVYNFSPLDHTGLDKRSLEMTQVVNGEFEIVK